jgi:hypothetical protein
VVNDGCATSLHARDIKLPPAGLSYNMCWSEVPFDQELRRSPLGPQSNGSNPQTLLKASIWSFLQVYSNGPNLVSPLPSENADLSVGSCCSVELLAVDMARSAIPDSENQCAAVSVVNILLLL